MHINKVIDIKDCKRGYILKGIENHRVKVVNGRVVKGHYIIFYEHIDGFDFKGAMLTSVSYNNQNASMKKEYFFNENSHGEAYPVIYNNSHLVKAKLHKFYQMGEFILVGLLTDEGISFLEEVIDNLDLVSWELFLKNRV